MSDNKKTAASGTRFTRSDKRLHTKRYRARRRAADILYEAETRDLDPVAIVDDRVELAAWEQSPVPPVAEYTKEIVAGAAEKLDEIDELIARFLSQEWELGRLPAVDRAIMRVSAWEILFNAEVPAAVAVVEGVELASEYSTESAAPYIHAVLDDIAQSVSADNPMVQDDRDDSGREDSDIDDGDIDDDASDDADAKNTDEQV
ncbi:transcription antitermination factor NusB [Corynebacterium propinquum]|uniref:transcription antitermination factor NusB n=1 Tax=Corynebacterium propinquum TaxID=43769 RepID=UPI0011A37496|nr:transcription antitermination factor NusB [Corynebacterium propinquum]MDK4250849.1 transcription antitermination factor NusB [Corynebacterium propinquum]WKS50141.1 transcription antitermination factor NusB [Corynebacterium propinquum]